MQQELHNGALAPAPATTCNAKESATKERTATTATSTICPVNNEEEFDEVNEKNEQSKCETLLPQQQNEEQ